MKQYVMRYIFLLIAIHIYLQQRQPKLFAIKNSSPTIRKQSYWYVSMVVIAYTTAELEAELAKPHYCSNMHSLVLSVVLCYYYYWYESYPWFWQKNLKLLNVFFYTWLYWGFIRHKCYVSVDKKCNCRWYLCLCDWSLY